MIKGDSAYDAIARLWSRFFAVRGSRISGLFSKAFCSGLRLSCSGVAGPRKNRIGIFKVRLIVNANRGLARLRQKAFSKAIRLLSIWAQFIPLFFITHFESFSNFVLNLLYFI